MFKIISPDQFKQIPWKNGKGITTELAISKNGTLDNFDWRLSIASVVENGDFSDFSGYWRNLVLLTGNGIELTHRNNQSEQLIAPLSIASFDGGSATTGKLVNSKITDFNVMHKIERYNAVVNTYTKSKNISIESDDLCFVYALDSTLQIADKQNNSSIELLEKHLLKIVSPSTSQFTVYGSMMIIITFKKRKTTRNKNIY